MPHKRTRRPKTVVSGQSWPRGHPGCCEKSNGGIYHNGSVGLCVAPQLAMELNVFGNDNLENTFEGLEITQRRQAMAKRGNNEGSIYKRADGRWAAVVSLPGGEALPVRQDTSGYSP